ncbi:hypothetical protein GGF31_007580 [Allomyces arbusculus]|nr:hypothetical protein GGF31_007580 [Allomyces arbusculus]
MTASRGSIRDQEQEKRKRVFKQVFDNPLRVKWNAAATHDDQVQLVDALCRVLPAVDRRKQVFAGLNSCNKLLTRIANGEPAVRPPSKRKSTSSASGPAPESSSTTATDDQKIQLVQLAPTLPADEEPHMTAVFLLRGDVNAAPELYSWLPGLVHVAQTRLAAGSMAPRGAIVLAVLSEPGFEAQLAPLVHPVAPKAAVVPHLACVAVRIPHVAPDSFPADPATDSPFTHLQRLLHAYPQPSAPYFESLPPRTELNLAKQWAARVFQPAATRIVATSMPLTGAKPKTPVPRKEKRAKRREARAASVPAKAAAAAARKAAKVVVAATDGPAATVAAGVAAVTGATVTAVPGGRDVAAKPSPGKKRAQPSSPGQSPPPGQRQSKKPRKA